MTKIISILLFISFLGSQVNVPKTYTIAEAVKKKIITCRITGNETGTHYTKALKFKFKNLRRKDVRILIENGRTFVPKDSAYQDFVTTEEIIFVLKKESTKVIKVNSMCMESSDKAPNKKSKYSASELGNENLRKLTKEIEKNKWFNPEAQNAVWALTCNAPLKNIAGFDTAAVRKLINQIASVTGKEIPENPNETDYQYNYYASETYIKRSVKGYFEYGLYEEAPVTIAMFNKDNIIVRELFNDKKVSPGKYKFNYAFDATVYTEDFYYFRLLLSGEVKMSLKYSVN